LRFPKLQQFINNEKGHFMSTFLTKVEGNVYISPKERSFPLNVFDFRNYNSWKVLSLIVFFVFTSKFGYRIYQTTIGKEEVVQGVQIEREGRGWIKRAASWIYSNTWQDYPEEMDLQKKLESVVYGIRFWSFVKLIMAWCFVWMCFDWNTAKYFIFSTICISIGIVYSLLPIDALPDFIPVAGNLDDLTVNIFGSGLGIASITEYYRKTKQRRFVEKLISQNPEVALTIALEDYNLSMDTNKSRH